MIKSVSQKMGIREGMRVYLKNVPEAAWGALDFPNLRISSRLVGTFDYMHFFVANIDELDTYLPILKSHLEMSGMLWVSWPKGKKQGTDLSLTEVIRIAYEHGLVESVSLSVDDTWSALKLTYPKKGKIYNNRYGKLPDSTVRR